MSIYADTGFICSLYAPDAHTGRTLKWMDSQSDPIFFSWLNQVEFRNALRLRVFRKEILPQQRDQSLNLLLADLHAGIFESKEVPLSSFLIETERLGARFSETLGTRSLDIMHVAIALSLGCVRFLSFDARQSKLARATGLVVPKL